ncbi:MAG TPA: iron-containing redox enzyme family protein [Candidatus Binatia bacterium]
MEDFIALRKRAREIYERNSSPRHTPYFPPPPDKFLSPEEFLDQLAEAVFVNSPKVQHPFVVKLVKGEWSFKQIQEWAKEGFHDKVQTIRNDAMIVATAPTLDEMKKQASVLACEVGIEHSGEPSHPELWLQFGEALGLSRDEIMNSKPTAITEIVITAEHARSMTQKVGGLPANLRLGERVTSIVYPIWAEVLRTKYNVSREGVSFFTSHEEADEDHSEIGKRIVLNRATTREAQMEMWLHQERSGARQWVSYDGYYQAAMRVQ